MSAPPPSYNDSGYPGGDKSGYHSAQGPPSGPYTPPPAGQYAPPPAGHYPPAGQAYGQPPPPTSTVTVVTAGGGCPNCRGGYFTDDYGCCAITLAILFFPIGILCCLAMRERKCTNCGYRA